MNEKSGKRPTALITGASGFIGGRLAMRLISSGWSVHAIVRPTSSNTQATAACASRVVYDGTLASLAGPVAEIGPDLVFHLASAFQQDKVAGNSENLIRSNVLFPVQLVEAMLAAGCRKLINTGTFWQHFEGRAYRPVDLYAATKQATEDVLLYFHEARELSCVTLTLFDTYGPRDPRRKLLNLILDAVGKEAQLELSPGEQIVDLTHVEDVVDAFCATAKSMLDTLEVLWAKAFVSGERMTLKALVDLVTSTSNAKVNVNFGARPYKAREVMLPISPVASAILGDWIPHRKLEQELRTLLTKTDSKLSDAV